MVLWLAALQAKAQYQATVDPNGTGNHTTIQAALNAAPANATAPYRIFIKKGVYYENLTITKPFIQFIGEDVAKTIITYNNYNGKNIPGGGTYGTANSASVIINADDFSAAHITFENTTGDAPQALAINVSGDRASFKNCRFLGGQDTFLSYNSKYPQSLYKCYIEGVVDFIFGNAKTVFDECTIYPRDRVDNQASSYITASNTRESKGFLFRNCEIIANRGTTKYVLGRPWQNDAATAEPKATSATVFVNTKMSNVVKPEGWSIWDAGTDVSKIIYAEYNSMDMSGNPLNIASRVSWSKQLNAGEVAEYLDNNIVFKDRNNVVWDPYAVFLDGNAVPTNRLAISNFRYTKTGTELTFKWNLNWPENNVTYRLYRIADGGSPILVNEQTITGNDVNLAYAPSTGKETVPPSMSTYEYYVEASSANGTVRSESATIAAIPVMSLTGTLQAFKQGIDKPSATQVLSLSGEYLQTDVTVTPPVNFEVSADNGLTWKGNSSPLVLTVTNGLLASKSVLVRLNASAAGLYSGNITFVSGTGSHNKTIAASGETLNQPLVNSKAIASISFAQNLNASYLKEGITTASLDLKSYVLSSQSTGNNVPFSTTSGVQFAPAADGGSWQTDNGLKNMTDKTKHIEISVKPSSTYEVRVDSILFNLAVFNTTGNFAIEYSTDNFATSTLLKSGLLNGSPLVVTGSYPTFANGTWLLENQNAGAKRYAFALNGATGVNVSPSQELKFRLYFRTGSSSATRYVTLKNVDIKGDVGLAAQEGDYRTISSGAWLDPSIWQKMVAGTWSAAPTIPHFGTGQTSFIQANHTVIAPNGPDLTTAQSGSYGYVNSIVVRDGGKLMVESGKTLNIHRDQLYQIDGEFENNGTVNNDGKYDLIINGTLTNNGTLKVDQTGSNVFIKGKLINKASVNYNYVTVKDGGVYEHAANSNTMPAVITFEDGATFLISGITTSQTGILKNTISYYNVIWNNTGQGNYYAFQGNLTSNVRGKFTVNSTGTTYLALLNANGTIGLGSYEQNGGRVLVRENGTVNAVLNIAGDFVVNSGTFESNSAASVKLNLKGTAGVYKYSDATTLLKNLTVDVVGNYTLQSPVISDNLTVEAGILTLGNNSLTVNSITRDNMATGYVITNGTGSLIVKNVGTTNTLIPLGTSVGYSPLSISNTGTSNDFSVSLKTGIDNALPFNANNSVNLQWNITPSGTGANANIQFQWTAANHNAGFSTSSPVSVANYHGGAYVGYAATLAGANPYTAAINNISQFSPFVVVNDGVLPLDLLSFEAKKSGTATNPQVTVNWKTANERNTDKFEVLRRSETSAFEVVHVQSAKNTTGEHQYGFVDRSPLMGRSYYQLKQYDKDGKETFSEISLVEIQDLGITLVAYPNPTEGLATLKFATLAKTTEVAVYDLQGRKQMSQWAKKGENSATLDFNALPKGLYFINLLNEGKKQTLKIIRK